MKYIFILCLSASFLFACKAKKKASEKEKVEIKEAAKPNPMQEQMDMEAKVMEEEAKKEYAVIQASLADSVVAQIRRTACFGRCPIYTLTVYEGGYTTYMGKKWVEKEGLYSTNVNAELLEQLMNKAEEVSFFELNNIYDNPRVTDLPSTITTLKNAEGFKTIISRYQAPEALINFEKYFDSLFSELEWKEVKQN